MNTPRALAAAAALAPLALAAAAHAQIEVVYAIEAHAPGNVKSQVPGLPGATFKNFPRPYVSPNGQRWVVVPTLNGFSGTQDQGLLTGIGLAGALVAQEGVTLDSDQNTFAFFTNVSPRVSNDGRWVSAVSGGDRIVRGDLSSVVTVLTRSGGSEFAPPGVLYGFNGFSAANDTAAGPAFLSVPQFSPGSSTKIGIVSGAAAVSTFVDIPAGQAGGTQYRVSDIDANSFWTDAAGTAWLAQGKIENPDQAADKVLIVTGAVRIQEGTPLAGLSSPVSTIAESFMEPNGDWFSRGTNADGTTWIVRNGAVVAHTGEPVTPGSSELWTNLLDAHGNAHGGFAVVGRTNNPDPNLSDIIVVNGRFIAARESDAVDLNNDGQTESNLFVHVMQNRVMFAGDGYVYFAARLKGAATDTADLPGSVSSSSLLRVPACPADLGRAGGLPGADATLDNNDFIAFISLFFAADPRADRGVSGGLPGRDGQFDNNDFIAFISLFFAGC